MVSDIIIMTRLCLKILKPFMRIPKLKEYYKNRGERFGFPTKNSDAAKNNLIWLGLNRDDFKNFAYFMAEFKEFLSTKRYDNAYWKEKFTRFYFEKKDYNNEPKYFDIGINKYPKANRKDVFWFVKN
jgi:hypothetical protein